MFIKKDRRRIDQILEDGEDSRESLLLSKRVPEFQGSTRILLREVNLPALKNLKVLNLYDNGLNSLPGIGLLSHTPVEEINLGCNKLTTLPIEFGQISTLKSLWLDDNEFEEFPVSVTRLPGLVALRISGNKISYVPDVISNIASLEVLAIDNNDLVEICEGIFKLLNLKKLWLRQNRITRVPETISSLVQLETLSLSSNHLIDLPESLSRMPAIRNIYVNGNALTEIPEELVRSATLQVLNLANNRISSIPPALSTDNGFGNIDKTSGLVTKKDDGRGKDFLINLYGNAAV